MKIIRILLVMVCTIVSSSLLAQDKTESFKVWGECSMCKKKIEAAAKVQGVKSFEWNEETKQARIVYDIKVISLEEIQKKIATAGYDTQKYKASKLSYKTLPSCCQYDRG